jgi:hypothetical protein
MAEWGAGQEIQQQVERSRMAKQVAVLRRFGHAVMNARHAAGDGANDAALAEGNHKPFVKSFEFGMGRHPRCLPIPGDFVERKMGNRLEPRQARFQLGDPRVPRDQLRSQSLVLRLNLAARMHSVFE